MVNQAHFKEITTTGSSANFLSPEPNGQGFRLDNGHLQTWLGTSLSKLLGKPDYKQSSTYKMYSVVVLAIHII